MCDGALEAKDRSKGRDTKDYGEQRMTYEEVLRRIENEVKKYFEEKRKPTDTVERVTLMTPYYDHKEVMQVIDSLLREQITLNHSVSNKVRMFEDMWSEYIGVKEGVMTNSGSSANLIALHLLTNPTTKDYMKAGSEVITPALTWTTTVSPIWNVNCKPVFVDVDPNTYTMDPVEIEKAITDKTRAIMPVHLLGYPCDMGKIMDIAKKHNLFVIEDCCEAHGGEIGGKKIGSFGDIATFSFFLSHHMTTLEGGMVMTNNWEYAELARTMRSQGVIRNSRSEEFKKRYYENEKYKHIQQAYLFSNIGFNVRPTELNGGFGIEQFKKFPTILQSRIDNARFFLKEFAKYTKYLRFPEVGGTTKHAWFSLPIYVKEDAPFTRHELESFLNKKGIETRQIMTGDITSHPASELYDYKIIGDLRFTKAIHKNAFFFGNHPLIGEKERRHVLACFNEFMQPYL